MVKWLLDTGASIDEDTNVDRFKDKKPCKSYINIVADGNIIKRQGIGTKTIFHKLLNQIVLLAMQVSESYGHQFWFLLLLGYFFAF